MSKFDAQLKALFASVQKKIDHAPRLVAETATEHFKEALQKKQWNGKPYQPYKNKKREPTRGSLMMREMNLFNSIKPSVVTSTYVRISAGGSRAPYAKVHNEGLRIRGVRNRRPYHNNNFMGKGKRLQVQATAYRVDYKMPQRQFMGKSPALFNAIKTRFKTNFKTL